MKKSPPHIKSSSPIRKTSKSLISPALVELRKEIDRLDENIWSLLSRRFALTKKVAKIKQQLNIAVYDAKREEAVLTKIKSKRLDPSVAAAISKLYQTLFVISKKYQQPYTKSTSSKDKRSLES